MGELKPIEHWASVKATPPWLAAALRIFRGWGLGQEVTEEAYDLAADETNNIPIGYSDRFAKVS